MDVRDGVALVTGGGAGIGAGVARRLADAGATVIVADASGEAAQHTVDEIESRGGGAVARVLDVTDRDAVARMLRRLPRLDVVVNNAGGVEGDAFPSASPDAWARTLELNLHAPMFVIQGALALLLERGGVVVNIASMAGIGTGAHDYPEYAAAKAGLVRLTTALASLRTVDVRVNCICPDWVDTPASRRTRAAMSDDELSRVPDPMLHPSDVADVVMRFVADDELAGEVMVMPCGAPPHLLRRDG